MSRADRFCWRDPDELVWHTPPKGARPAYPSIHPQCWLESWIKDHPDELDKIGPEDRIVSDVARLWGDDIEKWPMWKDWRKEHGL